MVVCKVLRPYPDPVAGFATAYVAHAINLLQAAEQQHVQTVLDRHFRPAALANSSWETFFEPIRPTCHPYQLINKSDQYYRNLRLRYPHSVHQWKNQYVHRRLPFDAPWYARQRSEGARLFHKYIRIRPEIVSEVNHTFAQLLGQRSCVGVHLRGTDKGDGRIATDWVRAVTEVDKRLQAGNESAIFLATDDEDYLTKTVKRYNTSMLFYLPALRTRGKLPTFRVHDAVQASHEVLRDIMCLSKCSYLVAGASSVSEMVMYMNPWLHNNSVLVDYL